MKTSTKTFIKKCISATLIAFLAFHPLASVAQVFAQEASTSAQVEVSPTPEVSATPEVTASPDVTPSTEPSIEPSVTPEVTATPEPSLSPTPELSPSPEATPSSDRGTAPTRNPELQPSLEASAASELSLVAKRTGVPEKKSSKTAENFVKDEVLVRFKKDKLSLQDSNGKEKSKNFADKHGLDKKEDLNIENITVLKIKNKESVKDVVEKLKKDDDVESVQPNYIYSYETISTNDTNRGLLWGLDNTGQTVNGTAGTADADIDAPEGWAYGEGSGVIVAVIDSGVDYNHPDLLANMWNGSTCKNENNVTINNCNYGYDYEENDTTPLPSLSDHGTHVAGTIAAVKNNAAGILGVAPSAKIMAIKSGLTSSDNIKSINFARYNGAKVINASWGGPSSDAALETAISNFPGVFIAAAGNDGADNDGSPKTYPCAMTASNIVCVAATDQNDGLASFSNYGASSVDIGAPGTNIYSTVANLTTSNVYSESFEAVADGGIPAGYTENGNWGVFNLGGSWGKVLYGDVVNLPYVASANSLYSSPTYNMSGSAGAYFDFWTACDTEYAPNSDYMALEISADGTNFTELVRWNEWYIDSDSDPNNTNAVYHVSGTDAVIPKSYLTSTFKYRLRWVADGDASVGQGDGCLVDDMTIKKTTLGASSSYGYKDGTSMAAPHVAGIAAAAYALAPSFTSNQMRSLLVTTGDTIPALSGKTSSGKRANMAVTLASVSPPATPVANPPGGTHYGPLYVTLTSAYSTAIRYTTDGSTPNCSTSTFYSAPVLINATKTLKAIGCNNYGNSSVLTATYTLTSAASSNYLAEGYIGGTNNFKTNILIQNPQASSATVEVTYLVQGGDNFTEVYTIGANTRATVGPPISVAGKSFATMIFSDKKIVVERTMYWDATGIGRVGGTASQGVTTPTTTWYLAEGYTGGVNNFKTNVSIANPNNTTANITVTYMIQSGGTVVENYTVTGYERATIGPPVSMANQSFSTKVESDQNVVVERTMYWDSGSITRVGGTASQGITTPVSTWYLAEGYTGGASNFKTNILIQNPNNQTADVTVTYMLQSGGTVVQNQTLSANSRVTMGPPASMLGESFSTKVESNRNIVVERTMYWDSGAVARKEGHASAGIPTTNTAWYLAEGYIGGANGFKTNVLVQNPNVFSITITATYMNTLGATITQDTIMGPQSRATVGPPASMLGQSFSTKVESASPIVVERTMYWDSAGYARAGGHASAGITLN